MKGITIDISEISDSREVMESRESPKIQWFIYILLIFILCGIIFACFFEVDEYTKISGEIKTFDASSSVMSISSCKIKEILVEEGEHVNEGDVLFVLNAEYAKEQYDVLNDKKNLYNSELENIQLLKQSVEQNKNFFKNDETESKYYYQYEQYQNELLLALEDIDKSQLNNNLSAEEKENNLKTINEELKKNNNELEEYKSLLHCVQNNCSYNGSIQHINSSYSEFDTNYRKSQLLSEQYRLNYDNLVNKFNEQSQTEIITSLQVESANKDVETAYTAINSYQASYISELNSIISTFENQLTSLETEIQNTTNIGTSIEEPITTEPTNNAEIISKSLNAYRELKKAIEQGNDFLSDNISAQESYNQYKNNYTVLLDDYNNKLNYYNNIYNQYVKQTNEGIITQENINSAKCSYESANLDIEVLKNTYISQIQSKISTLENDIKTLENEKSNLEISIKGISDLEEYKKLSEEKFKNQFIVSINSNIDSITENISSIETQIIELKQTIDNSEIKASCAGVITLLQEINTDDIVQAGSQLCSIVPDSGELKATLYIPENAISKIKVGQKTEYIFDAIPYNEYGKITGEIQTISADSFANETTNTKFYIAQADLSSLSLQNKDGNVRELKTGMMLEAKTISGSKKAIIWLLQKINLID